VLREINNDALPPERQSGSQEGGIEKMAVQDVAEPPGKPGGFVLVEYP